MAKNVQEKAKCLRRQDALTGFLVSAMCMWIAAEFRIHPVTFVAGLIGMLYLAFLAWYHYVNPMAYTHQVPGGKPLQIKKF